LACRGGQELVGKKQRGKEKMGHIPPGVSRAGPSEILENAGSKKISEEKSKGFLSHPGDLGEKKS